MKQVGTLETVGNSGIVVGFGIHYQWEEMGAAGSKSELADAIRASVDPSKTTVANIEGSLSGRNVSDILELPQNPHDWVEALLCSSCEYIVNHDYLMCVKGHLTCHQCWESTALPCQFSLTSDNSKLEKESSHPGDNSESEDEESSSGSSTDGAAGGESDDSSSATDSESDESEGSQSEQQEPSDNRAVAAASGVQAKGVRRQSESESDTSDDEHWKSMLELGLHDPPNPNSVCRAQLIKQRHIVVDQLLNKIQLYCPNARRGCKVTLPIGQIDRHYKEDCGYSKPDQGYIQGKKKWSPKNWTGQQKKKNYRKSGRDGST